MVRVAIVGGGISGLAAAWRLAELGRERGLELDVRLFEAGPELGGQVATERVGGLLLEAGADQVVTYKPAGIELCRRLGLETELVHLDGTRRGATQVVHRGRLARLPAGTALFAPTRLGPLLRSPLLSPRGRLRAAIEPLVAARERVVETDDESLGAFVARRFGRELLERIAEPVFAGIYMADPDALSLQMTAPRLLDLERRPGGVVRGLRAGRRAGPAGGFFSLKLGLGRLVDRLASELPGGWIRPATRVTRVVPDQDRWSIGLEHGSFTADVVILACPAWASAGMLRDWDAPLASALQSLPHASCATVYLAYEGPGLPGLPPGFGFFVPRVEPLPLLACSNVSAKFPDRAPQGVILLRAFLGGARHPELMQRGDDELAELAHRTLSGLLGIRGEPSLHRVYRFDRAMPQWPVGYRRTIERISKRLERHPRLYLCGGAMGAMGLPDCVRAAEHAASLAIGAVRALGERRVCAGA